MTAKAEKLTRSTAKIIITEVDRGDDEPPRYQSNLRHRDAPAEDMTPCRHKTGHPTNFEAVECGEDRWRKLDA